MQYITQSIQNSISCKQALLADGHTLELIKQLGQLLYTTFGRGGKVLLCGNGGSAADAQHIAAEFVGRFVTERQGLHAVALTTDTSIITAVANDYGFESLFERQVSALGREGDIFIGLSTSGNSVNVERALSKARAMGLTTVGLLGGSGGRCLELCDYPIIIDSKEAARIQESHILVGHILCGLVDLLIQENG